VMVVMPSLFLVGVIVHNVVVRIDRCARRVQDSSGVLKSDHIQLEIIAPPMFI
jgi:hypothetical protein